RDRTVTGVQTCALPIFAAGIIWVAALLAAVLSLDRLFAADYADGGLDLIALSAMPLEMAVLAKAAAHWLTTGLPLVIVSPLLARSEERRVGKEVRYLWG